MFTRNTPPEKVGDDPISPRIIIQYECDIVFISQILRQILSAKTAGDKIAS